MTVTSIETSSFNIEIAKGFRLMLQQTYSIYNRQTIRLQLEIYFIKTSYYNFPPVFYCHFYYRLYIFHLNLRYKYLGNTALHS